MKTKKENKAENAGQTKVYIPMGDGNFVIDVKKLEDPLWLISTIFQSGADIHTMFDQLCHAMDGYIDRARDLAEIRKNLPDKELYHTFIDVREVVSNSIRMCQLFSACAMLVHAFEHEPDE